MPWKPSEEEHDALFLKDERVHTFAGWIAAFTIFAKYEEAARVRSDYYEIHVKVDPTPVSEDDLRALLRLGWHADYGHEHFWIFK